MKRIILMLTVAAMMVVAMSVTAAPAFAFGHPDCTKDGPIVTCEGKNKNWTQTQKGSTHSSHPERNRNKGGNFPPGQQG